MRELVKEMELESGCYRVLWLIPSEQRSVLIGPQGRQVQQIKTETGLQTLLLTREAETEVYFGEAYAQVHLAGKPDTTRRALAAIDSLVGGRLAEDGFGGAAAGFRSSFACLSARTDIPVLDRAA